MFSSTCYVSYFCLFFFFLMLRRPPRSTLFPTRRSSDLPRARAVLPLHERLRLRGGDWCRAPRRRSEEHTSELQSLRHLVCRLLLEKKKKKKKKKIKLKQKLITKEHNHNKYKLARN